MKNEDYIRARLVITEFDTEDVILTSGQKDDIEIDPSEHGGGILPFL